MSFLPAMWWSRGNAGVQSIGAATRWAASSVGRSCDYTRCLRDAQKQNVYMFDWRKDPGTKALHERRLRLQRGLKKLLDCYQFVSDSVQHGRNITAATTRKALSSLKTRTASPQSPTYSRTASPHRPLKDGQLVPHRHGSFSFHLLRGSFLK